MQRVWLSCQSQLLVIWILSHLTNDSLVQVIGSGTHLMFLTAFRGRSCNVLLAITNSLLEPPNAQRVGRLRTVRKWHTVGLIRRGATTAKSGEAARHLVPLSLGNTQCNLKRIRKPRLRFERGIRTGHRRDRNIPICAIGHSAVCHDILSFPREFSTAVWAATSSRGFGSLPAEHDIRDCWCMSSITRTQHRYDHRLENLFKRPVPILNQWESCQCFLASSEIARTKIAGNVWSVSWIRRCTLW